MNSHANATEIVAMVEPPCLPVYDEFEPISEAEFICLMLSFAGEFKITVPNTEAMPLVQNGSITFYVVSHCAFCSATRDIVETGSDTSIYCDRRCWKGRIRVAEPFTVNIAGLLQAISQIQPRYWQKFLAVKNLTTSKFMQFIDEWASKEEFRSELVKVPFEHDQSSFFLSFNHVMKCSAPKNDCRVGSQCVYHGCFHCIIHAVESLEFDAVSLFTAKMKSKSRDNGPTTEDSLHEVTLSSEIDATRTCLVCFDNGEPHWKWRDCAKCQSHTCEKCFTKWLTTQIEEGHAVHLNCISCSAPISAEDIAQFCSPTIQMKYRYFTSRFEHQKNKHALWCSNPSCRELLYGARSPLHAPDLQCVSCKTITCVGCHEEAHEGQKCIRPIDPAGRKIRSSLWRAVKAKRCPNCQVYISKNGGCNEMRCTRCRAVWCFRCRKLYRMRKNGTHTGNCICSKIAEATAFTVFLAVTAVAVPVTIAAAAVIAPPVGIVYAVSRKEKKERMRERFKQWIEDDYSSN